MHVLTLEGTVARGKRGGYRPPAKPAAVSGPGALSARTDGRVPTPPVTGLPYGQNQALQAQQSAAPLSAPAPGGGGAGSAPAPTTSPAGPPNLGPAGAFSPTQRPGEPLTAGVDWGAGPGAPPALGGADPYLLLKLIHQQNPTNATARLIARLSRG